MSLDSDVKHKTHSLIYVLFIVYARLEMKVLIPSGLTRRSGCVMLSYPLLTILYFLYFLSRRETILMSCWLTFNYLDIQLSWLTFNYL